MGRYGFRSPTFETSSEELATLLASYNVRMLLIEDRGGTITYSFQNGSQVEAIIEDIQNSRRAIPDEQFERARLTLRAKVKMFGS